MDSTSVKSLKPTDQIEIEIPHFRHPDFRPWLAMILSILSVVVSAVALLHGQNDGEAKAAYEAQSRAVMELSLQNQELSLELAVLRGYAEGQSKSLTVAVPVKPGASAVPAGSFSVQIPLRVVPFKDVQPDEWTAPVPKPRPALKPVTLPEFDSLGKPEKK
jgi:hypothetical protein